MGNVHSISSLTRTTGALDSFIADLGGDIVYEKNLGTARFLKAVKCKHQNGYLVAKIYIKHDPGLSLRNYHKRLKADKEALTDIPNVYNFQAFVETEKAGYIFRQWIASNLYDRISTRPFLSMIEKRWIAFQLLNALRDARNRKVSHGDIKSQNILVTSWNWIYLTDFASYKPTYLPLDDPRKRFYTASENPEISAKKAKIAMDDEEGRRDGKVTEAMDCFSAGCVIAELFLEGAQLFTLSQLYKYREGEYSVEPHLASIGDEGIQNLIMQMISLEPSARPAFDTLLQTSRGAVSIAPTTIVPSASGNTIRTASASATAAHLTEQPSNVLPSDSDHRIERIWSDYESVEPYISPEATEEPVISKPFQDILPVELHIPNHDTRLPGTLPGGRRAAYEDGPALIILALVTSNIRNCSLPSSKVRALDVFLALASHLTDEAKLDRMIPYIVELLHDESALVRLSALRTLVQVVPYACNCDYPFECCDFPEYIIPNIRHLVHDPEVSVRCTYAQCLVQIADTALRYLEIGQALKAHGASSVATDVQDYENAHLEVSYEASLQELQLTIQDHLSALLTDVSSIVKRAVLHDISSLCIFLGRQATNDVLLSHMITYLNDRDWLLRYAFFESIVEVAACAGGRSLEEYILPLMLQALCDAAAFITAAVKQLPDSDIWCILYPSLRHYLKSDVVTVDEKSLLLTMKPALPRQILDFAVQWAMKAESTSFWRRRGNNIESPRESMISMKRGSGSLSRNRSEEDDTQIEKLQKMGMTHSDETKLQSMRDYIVKLALATSSFSSRIISEPDAGQSLKVIGDVELQKLGVVPQTVFLKTRSIEFGSRSSRIPSSSYASRRSSRTTPILSPRLGGRFSALDQGSVGSSAPFEDLRRRLATINGSASSLGMTYGSRDARSNLAPSPAVGGSSSPITPIPPPLMLDRPASPTESSISTTNSISIRPSSRVQMGSTDVQKAAPAIGSSKMNAIGLLEAHPKIRELSPERSGRTSPMSISATLRPSRPRLPSLIPISTYDGQEPGISNLLENLYLDNNRELQHDFGPKVHEGPIRRRNPVRHGFASRDSTKRVEPTLVANLTAHADAVTGIAVSPDHLYFVTSSDDKTVKVWDTARLERNVTSKPRHSYTQHHAKVKAVCTLEGVHCFASAADDGSLHVVRVHVGQGATGVSGAANALPKYGKLQLVREHRVDHVGEWITCMMHYNTDSASNLIYATTHSVITVLDLRTMQVLQMLENPRHYGPITCLCVDKKRTWILVGTSTGVLTLWDKRFGLLLRSWHVGVGSTGRSVRIHQCVVHPSKGRGKWVMVAVEISRKGAPPSDRAYTIWWKLLVETFVMRTGSKDDAVSEPHEMAGVDADTSPAAAIAALVRSRQVSDTADRRSSRGGADQLVPPPVPDVRAMVVGLDFGGYSTAHRSEFGELVDANSSPRTASRGFMITGSEDRKLRLWDLGRPERTTVLSGLENENEKPNYGMVTNGNASTYVETWSASSGLHSNRPSQRIALISNNQQQLLRAHLDVITSLACIDSPFRGGIVWRIDYVD
ncbi:other/VPS15 protein kinase [Cyathus striatus]|nr:other/VPS15 protein kinase [Cyathus striatus]